MPRTSAVNMKCPRSEHAGSRVKLDGTYGKPGHRRQRYTCLPGGGGKPHVFTELLPREESWHSSCEHCERQLERREGPKAPRHYQFVARGIAEALQAVGAGSTYMRASRVTRDRRGASGAILRPASCASRVMASCSPTGWRSLHRSCSSPSDRLPGRRKGRCCSTICPFECEPWTPVGGESPLARWLSMSSAASALSRASPSSGSQRRSQAPILPTGAPSWARCPAIPERIVCDGHGGMLAAIEARWPKAELHQCEWHLQHALDRLLAKEARSNSDGDLHEVREYAESALVGPSSWHRFVRAAKAAENESLDRWIAVNQGTIETQFARRALTPHRALDMPLTTAALDQITRPISAALYPRRYALKNRERLNRLLMLLQLHINGDDEVQAYARAIRLHLEANGGRPLAHRRALTDPLNSPSLR